MSCLPPVKTRDLPEGETAPEPEPINKEVFVARGNYDKIKHVLSKFDIDKDDVKLFGDEPLSSLKDYNVEEGKMPNVVGMGLRDALGILEKEGFVVGVSGKGIVMSQSIQKGDNVQKGTYVRIVLR
ncbi:MAG: PASTA domain-containing protein [Rikenellaceae bacterium]